MAAKIANTRSKYCVDIIESEKMKYTKLYQIAAVREYLVYCPDVALKNEFAMHCGESLLHTDENKIIDIENDYFFIKMAGSMETFESETS